MVISEEKRNETMRPLVTQIVENQLESKDNELGTENLSSVKTQENLDTDINVLLSEIDKTMKDFKAAIKNLAKESDNIEFMFFSVYKNYIDKIKKGNELIKNLKLRESVRSYLSIPIHENPPTIEEIKIDNITAINLYNIKLFAEKKGDIDVFKQSLPILNDLEKFVTENVEDPKKYKEDKEEILQLTQTQTQEGPSQGASSSQGDTSSEGATGSTSAEEETQTQEGPSQGASSSQGDTSSEGTTGSTSAEEETQTQNGPTSIAPSPEFRNKYSTTLQKINDAVDNLSRDEKSIEECLVFDNYQLTVDGNNQKIIELSKSTHVLEMTILNAQRTLINLELNEYKAHPFYYAKTDKELATEIENTNINLNKLNPKNNREDKGVAAFYEDKVKRINEVVAEINSLDANDDRRKELEELIVAFKRIINHRLMREVHFNQGFQIKQFLEEQAQNNIKIDTINPQQIKQPQPTPKHSPKKQPKASVEKFYEILGEEIIKLYAQNANNQSDDFETFFKRTIASNFDEFLKSIAQIDTHNIFKEEALDRKGPVKYYWKNSSSNNGPGAEITFTEFAKYFTKRYQKKKTTPEGFTSEFSDISIKLNPNKKRIQTVNRANDIIVNVTLSSITQLSDGSIQNDSLISEDVGKINNQQDMIKRKIIIKNTLKEKLQEKEKFSFSLTSNHDFEHITTYNNDEEYLITQNVNEEDNSKIEIKDEKGNLVYVIELSYDEEKTKSKLHM